MEIHHTVAQCKLALRDLQQKGQKIGFIPTMGALHQGHLSLVKMAQKSCDIVVVSIYVNPTQFGPNEDFALYPRTLTEDALKLQEVGCNFLFAPSTEEIYYPNEDLYIQMPSLSKRWEGAMRPGHFEGVALVVTKLLGIVRPDKAFFGHKDFQQSVLIRQLARDLFLDCEIITGPTLREADGLAMSSRNRYLSAHERSLAPVIYNTLMHIKKKSVMGAPTEPLQKEAIQLLKAVDEIHVDYFDIVSSKTLEPLQLLDPSQEPVAIVAVKLGTTRLLDNMKIFD